MSTATNTGTWHASLTSQFTPPAACTPTDTWAGPAYSSPLIIQRVIKQSSSCFAPGWTSAPDPFQHGGNTWTGAPLCPSGQLTGLPIVGFDGKTTAFCCSSGWGYPGSDINIEKSTTWSLWSCATSFPSTTTSVGSPVGDTGSTQLTGEGSIESTAEYVFSNDEKDLATTSTRSSSQAAQPISTNLPTTASATVTPSASSEPSSGLRSGAEAGIGIGVAVVALVLIGAVMLYFLRRRKRTGEGETAGGEDGNQVQELDDNLRAELHGGMKPLELQGSQDTATELPENHSGARLIKERGVYAHIHRAKGQTKVSAYEQCTDDDTHSSYGSTVKSRVSLMESATSHHVFRIRKLNLEMTMLEDAESFAPGFYPCTFSMMRLGDVGQYLPYT